MRFVSSCTLLFVVLQVRAADYHGPWDVKSLQVAPKVKWVDESGPIRKLYYESEPLSGKPTRVFAYLAQPEKAERKLPAMVLVHGGGGTAFREWAELWAKRGYVALAMDLGGCGPDRKRKPDGMPDQSDANKLPLQPKALKEIWTYHAVAAVIRGVSLVSNLPNVDTERIGITGISWGGYLTCIVMGLDYRLKVAVPVYGCGFLHENSVWLPTFQKMSPDWRKTWVENFDPSKYAGQAKMPVLFVNGTKDFAYPLDSYQKTYRLVKNRTLCVTVNMPHGHKEGWSPKEIGIFVDSVLTGGKPLATIHTDRSNRQSGSLWVSSSSIGSMKISVAMKAAKLIWTSDLNMPWQKRKWQIHDANGYIDDNKFDPSWSFELPKYRPLVYFFTITDGGGATVSTEHAIIEK